MTVPWPSAQQRLAVRDQVVSRDERRARNVRAGDPLTVTCSFQDIHRARVLAGTRIKHVPMFPSADHVTA